jgi:hypothetical protein
MTVNEEFSLEVFLTRSTDWSPGTRDSFNKPSDVGRSSLFIRDGNNDEFEAIDGTGAAYGTLLYPDPCRHLLPAAPPRAW